MITLKPTWKRKIMVMIILLSLISFVVVSTNDNGTLHKKTNPRDGYTTVFKNIPKLFQHFIDVVEEKPGLLERNDVSVFKREANQSDISLTNSGNDDRNRDEEIDLEEKTETTEDGGSAEGTLQKDNAFQVAISDDFYEYIFDSDEENKTFVTGTTARSAQFEGDVFLGALGMNSFKLTPEEISSNAVKVEQMLNDYNSSK